MSTYTVTVTTTNLPAAVNLGAESYSETKRYVFSSPAAAKACLEEQERRAAGAREYPGVTVTVRAEIPW